VVSSRPGRLTPRERAPGTHWIETKSLLGLYHRAAPWADPLPDRNGRYLERIMGLQS